MRHRRRFLLREHLEAPAGLSAGLISMLSCLGEWGWGRGLRKGTEGTAGWWSSQNTHLLIKFTISYGYGSRYPKTITMVTSNITYWSHFSINISNLRYTDDTTLMAENEELKSFLMKVKEESEKFGLKLNIQKTEIMASSPITSWQIDGETVETVANFIFLGLQNHCRWWLQPWN